MDTIQDLAYFVGDKAREYLEETGVKLEQFPMSIVDFVIEHATEQCHFPKNFSEKQMVTDLARCKNSLAMACNDVYAKAGAEGQTAHSENGISRS